LAGVGALAVLILAFVGGQGWDKEEKVSMYILSLNVKPGVVMPGTYLKMYY